MVDHEACIREYGIMTELRGKRIDDRRLAAMKNLSSLQVLHLHNTVITDAGFALLAQAVNLCELAISSQFITDQSMEVLCTLPRLQSLLIHDAPFITDAGVGFLRKRKELSELYLKGTHVSDRGVPSWTHLEGLWSLGLDKTLVTDRGVATLAPMRKLGLLNLSDTAVGGHGLCSLPVENPIDIYLANCPVTDEAVLAFSRHLVNLNRLSLFGTLVTDRCLPVLAELSGIQRLRLSQTTVTDAGMESLLAHPSLQTLEVCDTEVSEEMKQRLIEASPHDLTVIR
jgi:internalin A